MRIWDISPGYLNDRSLLGEHRELHAVVSIILNKKKGYSRHPETLRWVGHVEALGVRHRMLAEEMALRGFNERSPVDLGGLVCRWPGEYIDEPIGQFAILGEKYRERGMGRIALPASAQVLWSQHKYSVMARDVKLYRELGQVVSRMRPGDDFSAIARMLTELLREPPGGMRNALEHMWGHVSGSPRISGKEAESWTSRRLLEEIRRRAILIGEPYLTASTALGELGVWAGESLSVREKY